MWYHYVLPLFLACSAPALDSGLRKPWDLLWPTEWGGSTKEPVWCLCLRGIAGWGWVQSSVLEDERHMEHSQVTAVTEVPQLDRPTASCHPPGRQVSPTELPAPPLSALNSRAIWMLCALRPLSLSWLQRRDSSPLKPFPLSQNGSVYFSPRHLGERL
jgi:hypothetical protein